MKKVLGTIFSIIKVIVWIAVLTLIAIVLTQRISNNTKSALGFRIFTVVTESMVPMYEVGDAILVKDIDASELKVGDVVTYLGEVESFEDRIVTHQIIKINKNEDGTYKIQTKGIANEDPDPEINDSRVYGKVIYKIKTISFLNGIIGNLYGMYFIIVVPMAIMMFYEHMRNKKIDEEMAEEKKKRREKYEEKNKKDEEEDESEEDRDIEDNKNDNDEESDDDKEKRKRRRHHRRS